MADNSVLSRIMRKLFIEEATLDELIEELGLGKDSLYKYLQEIRALFLIKNDKCGKYGARQYLREDEYSGTMAAISACEPLKATEILRLMLILRLARKIQRAGLPMSQKAIIKELEMLGIETINENGLRATLKLLTEDGLLLRGVGGKLQYALSTDLDELTDEELRTLGDYVLHCALTSEIMKNGAQVLTLVSDTLRARTGYGYQAVAEYCYNHVGRALIDYVAGQFLQARDNARWLEITYRKEQTKERRMTVYPFLVVFDDILCRWLAVGIDRSGKLTDAMLLENVVETKIVDADAERPCVSEQLRARFENSWLVSSESQVTVQAKFYLDKTRDKSVFTRLQEQKRHGELKKCGEYWEYNIVVNGSEEIKPWLLSFGSSVEIVAPEKLRNAVIKIWQDNYEMYGASDE